jgi:hypothetical protein
LSGSGAFVSVAQAAIKGKASRRRASRIIWVIVIFLGQKLLTGIGVFCLTSGDYKIRQIPVT